LQRRRSQIISVTTSVLLNLACHNMIQLQHLSMQGQLQEMQFDRERGGVTIVLVATLATRAMSTCHQH